MIVIDKHTPSDGTWESISVSIELPVCPACGGRVSLIWNFLRRLGWVTECICCGATTSRFFG
jgi:hypothetical protein